MVSFLLVSRVSIVSVSFVLVFLSEVLFSRVFDRHFSFCFILELGLIDNYAAPATNEMVFLNAENFF